jgi:serine/threonine-protein kinase
MADVILAVARGPGGFQKLLVIKRLRYHLADDPEFVSMLVDEARLAARLNHPNIVHTNEVGEVDGQFFIAMEYLEGQPLTRLKRRAAKEGNAFSRDMQLRVVADVLAGLHHAHELSDYDGKPLGVVHRDMSPSNVFVTYDGIVKVVDFGIAKAAGRTTETRTGVVKGKMTYMPPEQALGLEVDRRADLFSVGVMLWEAVTEQRLWSGLDDMVILGRLINGDIPASPRAVKPDVPEALERLCNRALAVDAADRFATALEFQNELEAFLESCPHQHTNREIGRLTSRLFESDRREMKSVIEGQLSKIRGDLANSLEPVAISESFLGSGALGSGAYPSPTVTAQGMQLSLPEPAPTAARRRRSVVSLALVAAITALGALWFLRSGFMGTDSAATATAPAATEAPTAAPASTAAAKTDTVRITLRAVPADARFSIDDGALLDNPYAGEVERSSDRHEIRVEAPGHASRTIDVTFDKDVLVDLALKREEPAAGRQLSRAAPPPASPPPVLPPLVPPPTPKKPRGEIDTDDPWK